MTDPRDTRILLALDNGPRSAPELSDVLRQELLDAWAEEQGFDIEWGTDAEPAGARILAISTAKKRGSHVGQAHEVLRRLYSLERRGLVQRIRLEGHRPILWRRIECEEQPVPPA